MSAPYPPQRLAESVNLQDRQVALATPPGDLVVREHLGLITVPAVDGQVVYRTERGTLFETRAVKTPGGDYLLMFPTNTLAYPEGRTHYGHQNRKVNDLVAFRSSDQGTTWHGPTRPIDIDYNLHGFIPLTPRAGNGHSRGPDLLLRHPTHLGPPHHQARPARKRPHRLSILRRRRPHLVRGPADPTR